MLCLDNRNRLIAEETLSKGTVDQTPLYLHEVINAALKYHVQALILVHNQLSGETTPSPADIQMTEELQRSLSLVTVDLHDHLTVAVTQCISHGSIGLLGYGCCRSYLSDDVTLSLAWRVNSPARRLARNRPGFAASNALPAASPAFF